MKPKRLDLDQQSQDWHEWRSYGIGASEAAIIYMGDEFPYSDTIQKLWAKKSGVIATEPVDNDAVKRGHLLEPVARELFSRKTGIHLFPMCYEHPYYEYIKASLDGITQDGMIIGEIKCPSRPDRHGHALAGKIHDEYYFQMQHQFLVTQAKLGFFISYFPNYDLAVWFEQQIKDKVLSFECKEEKNAYFDRLVYENSQTGEFSNDNDFVIVSVKPNHAVITELTRKLNKFWKYVEEEVMPLETELSAEVDPMNRVGLVMFSGYARAGKDTMMDGYKRVLKTARFAFAEPLKDVYCEMKGITRAELEKTKEKHRDGLVALGKGMRKIYPDIWLKGVFKPEGEIYAAMKEYGAGISDSRYVNEAVFGRLEADRLDLPSKLVWIDSEARGIFPANEEEAQTTSLLKNMADAVFINDVQVNDEKLLQEAVNKVVFRIANGQKEVRLSDILNELGVIEVEIYAESTAS